MPAGRRPGNPDTRAEILEAARTEFASAGYHGASIRGIARRAGVDPSLVLHYFESKEHLFAASLALPVNPASVIRPILADPGPGVGERLVRAALTVWDSDEAHEPLVAALRSVVSGTELEATTLEFAQESILAAFRDAVDGPESELRASLLASHLIGVLVGRYLIRVEPLASESVEDVASHVGPVIERYLFPS